MWGGGYITLVISGLRFLTELLLNNLLMRVECQCLQRRQGRGCTHGHVCPRQARLGVDVYQFRSQRLAPVIHSSVSSPLTGPGSVSSPHYLQPRNLFMSHRCKCLYSTNAGWRFYSPKKMCTDFFFFECAEIVWLHTLSSLEKSGLRRPLLVFGARCQIYLFNTGLFAAAKPSSILVRLLLANAS